jgi:hypothetical protein
MKPGDRVICIDDRNWYAIPVRCICAGLIYTVKEVFTCRCGNVYVRLSEVDKYYNMWCAGCDVTEYTKMYFHIERFRLAGKEESREEIEEKAEISFPNLN